MGVELGVEELSDMPKNFDFFFSPCCSVTHPNHMCVQLLLDFAIVDFHGTAS